MEQAGQRLKRVRERLNLRYRDVEEASLQIANRRQNDEYVINLSRLSAIENEGTVPTIFRLYSLCTIYRLDMTDVLEWYGVNLANIAADAAQVQLERTNLLGFGANGHGEVLLPLSLDPGIDLRRTTFLSRMIQRWGKLPATLLNTLDLKNHRYGFMGSEDWSMYPVVPPGSLLLIDETRRKIAEATWSSEFDRPIYFLEHREGYLCGWCAVDDKQIVVQPHPASMCAPRVFLAAEVDVIGQVIGVAKRLDQGKRRRARA